MDNENMTESLTVIYTGPTVHSLGLKHNQVYDNGLPEYQAAMIEEYPLLSELFATVEDYSEGKFLSVRSPKWESVYKLLKEIEVKRA
ncbi:MAG: hypothetical protein IJQ08_04215 [Synergistaceae bacterium]|nr:hypothetical protein [Synergistaceae bacterium]